MPLNERNAMSQPEIAQQPPALVDKKNMSLLIRGAIWIAIGALIAAALVCVVWVLIGDQDGIIGRAFLTILLLAAFAGIAILEAGLAPNRPDWLALSSMVSWIVALLVGAVKIWLPDDDPFFSGAERFFQLLLVVGILQLALLHVRLFTPAARRHVTTFTRIIYIATLVFLGGLVGMLVFFLTFPHTFDYGEFYWRIVVAFTILAAVGTTLIPLLNALFAPKKPAAARTHGGAAAPAWPTYADGGTPLPVLPDGSPDWNAYYTGHPTPQPQHAALTQHEGQHFQTQPYPAPQFPSPQFQVPQSQAPQTQAPQTQAPQFPAPVAPSPAQGEQPPVPPVPPAPPAPQAYPPAPPLPPQ
ncbi:hypothetical protein [Microbacterium sp. 3J1]|uniref:hypothetical protein n=1 Tax=Microbacterium sp. 3J1 TaxID=861269 RepID=UPI000B2A51BB|nr:hypothetical protein [Microbacterium sp. 3J1]